MKYILKFVWVILLAILFVPILAKAQSTTSVGPRVDKVEFSLFHSETCPHCKAEIAFINYTLKPKYQDRVDFKMYEVGIEENVKMLFDYAKRYNANISGVPVTFIDGQVIHGFSSNETTGDDLMDAIEKAIKVRQKEKVAADTATNNVATPAGAKITVPGLGEIDPHTFSLPILTVVIGLLDGFNPCAMWALLFLITLLLGMENRRRMLLLGGLFILASGAVYFFFMAAWLNFIMFIGTILLIRVLIGVVAVVMGGKNLYDFWKNRKAEGVVCEVSGKEGTKKTFEKIKDIVYRQSLWWSIAGILILGFSVNLVELACSAGFPAIYTQILSMSGIPVWQKYFYMLGYIIFYMLDDMIVFAIAMVTLKQKVFGTKYAKYTNLVAGALILILGLLLIFKPEWIMFS